MKIKFIKEYKFLRGFDNNVELTVTKILKGAIVDTVEDKIPDEDVQWLIDNGFAEKVKENYLFDELTHEDQGDKVAVNIWFRKDKDGGHPKKMVDFIQFIEAVNVVSQDKGFMTRWANGSGWAICLKDDGQLDTTVTNNKLANAFCFEWGDDAEASIEKHPNEWRTILNYDWSKGEE